VTASLPKSSSKNTRGFAGAGSPAPQPSAAKTIKLGLRVRRPTQRCDVRFELVRPDTPSPAPWRSCRPRLPRRACPETLLAERCSSFLDPRSSAACVMFTYPSAFGLDQPRRGCPPGVARPHRPRTRARTRFCSRLVLRISARRSSSPSTALSLCPTGDAPRRSSTRAICLRSPRNAHIPDAHVRRRVNAPPARALTITPPRLIADVPAGLRARRHRPLCVIDAPHLGRRAAEYGGISGCDRTIASATAPGPQRCRERHLEGPA